MIYDRLAQHPHRFTPKLQSWYIPRVVRLIQIGEAQIATYPSEVLPKLGFQIKSAMDVKYRFIFGLADDELGYILDDQVLVENLINTKVRCLLVLQLALWPPMPCSTY